MKVVARLYPKVPGMCYCDVDEIALFEGTEEECKNEIIIVDNRKEFNPVELFNL